MDFPGCDGEIEPPRFGCAVLSNYTAEYLEWGDGPPLVLIPGLAGGVSLVTPLAIRLARHFRVISYQLRGEDDCFALRRRFALADMIEDLVELMDQLCLERPLVMGVSFGGQLALQFAARHRHRAAGLIVQGTDVRFEQSLIRQIAGQVLHRYPLPSDSPFVNQFFHLFFGGRPREQNLFEFVTRQCWQTDQSMMAYRFQMIEHLDLSDQLARIPIPTLVLAGEKDLLVSEKGLQKMKGSIPQTKLVRLPGAGHLAFCTHTREMACHVHQFALERGLLVEAFTN
jgi:pimeloyl-ACP methyl ester carboxylesterase